MAKRSGRVFLPETSQTEIPLKVKKRHILKTLDIIRNRKGVVLVALRIRHLDSLQRGTKDFNSWAIVMRGCSKPRAKRPNGRIAAEPRLGHR